MMIDEEWRPIEGWPGYFVSSLGRVRGKYGRILKPRLHTNGYLRVNLCRPPERPKDFYIQRLVAFAFIGSPPTADCHADHDDKNRQNNRRENIFWRSPEANRATRVFRLGSAHHAAKLSWDEVVAIREAQGIQRAIAKRFNISREYVRDIRSRKYRREL